MTKKVLSNEETIIDLLQKLLIADLAKAGANRDEIKDALKIGSEKVGEIYKYFSKKGVSKNG
ncbi:MAG: hypothetical protein ABI543_10830 [Ignavibacteria bacterium]